MVPKRIKRWYESLDDDLKNRFVTSVIIGGGLSVVMLIILTITNWDTSKPWMTNIITFARDFYYSFISFVVVTLALDYVSALNTWPQMIDKKFEYRFTKIIEYFALGTKNQNFEKAINLVRETHGRIQWIVAKFVSEKLSREFDSSASIEIRDVHIMEYSAFVTEIISECKRSMKWTCPYSPSEWFKKLKRDDYEKLKKDGKDLDISKSIYPEHLVAFIQSRVAKQYVVNIGNSKYIDLIDKKNRWDFEQFTKYLCENNGIDLKFMEIDLLPITIKRKNSDYMIFDDRVIIEWEKNQNDENLGNLRLVNQDHDQYTDIFTKYWNTDACHNIAFIKGKITSSEQLSG